MTTILLAVLGYLVYVLLWFVICLVAYYIGIAFKKQSIFNGVLVLSSIVIGLLYLAIWGGLVFWGITLLLDLRIFALILLFIFSGFLMAFFQFLLMPFMFIPGYFASKTEAYFEEREAEAESEVLDEHGKIIHQVNSNDIKSRVAKYFLLVYFLDIGAMLVSNENANLGEYILGPALRIGAWTLLMLIIVSIYNLVRYRTFKIKNKHKVFIFTMRLFLALYIFMLLLILIYSFSQ